MRSLALAFSLSLLAACGQGDESDQPAQREPSYRTHRSAGEERTEITAKGETAAVLRTGPLVPVSLPPGFSLYPGSKVLSNTVVERAGTRGALLLFETTEPVEKVMLHYRAEADAAGMTVELDIAGSDRASLGGTLVSGGELAISARREGNATRIEFAQS